MHPVFFLNASLRRFPASMNGPNGQQACIKAVPHRKRALARTHGVWNATRRPQDNRERCSGRVAPISDGYQMVDRGNPCCWITLACTAGSRSDRQCHTITMQPPAWPLLKRSRFARLAWRARSTSARLRLVPSRVSHPIDARSPRSATIIFHF